MKGLRGQVSFSCVDGGLGYETRLLFSCVDEGYTIHQDCLANITGAFPPFAQTKTTGCHEHPTSHNAPRQKAARPRRVP
jgi:hypothetical protein